jgi:integral membrane sensor domain MASE1
MPRAPGVETRHRGRRGGGLVPWRLLILVALGYAAGSLVAFVLFEASTAGAVLFPPAGVSLAALVLTRPRQWPWVLATVAVTEVVLDLSQGQSLDVVWGFALANTLEPLVSATLLRRLLGPVDLARRRDLGLFVLCAVLAGPFVGGLVGGTTIAVGFDGSWPDAFAPFWAGDALGALTVGGTVLTWISARRAGATHVTATVVTSALLTAAVTLFAFWPHTVPLAYLPMPLLFGLAFRYGVAVVAAAGLAMTLTANVVTVVGRGPWEALADSPNAEVATLQLFLGVAVLGAWLLAVEIAERERAARLYEREHEAAHQLQRALLPEVPARLPGADIGAAYRPADEQHDVGGDWYDAFTLPDGRVALVVGDIVGHDLHAAAAMGRLHAVLRAIAASPHDGPAAVLEGLDLACGRIPGAPFSTVGYAEFDPATRRLRYACAGHPPPLVADDEGVRYLWDGRSPLLGVGEGARPDAAVAVQPGSMLLWYSDGLVERRQESLDVGFARLAEVVGSLRRDADPQAWCDAVGEAMTGGQRMEDDLVLVCLRLLTGPVPEPSPDGQRGAATPGAAGGPACDPGRSGPVRRAGHLA